MSAIPSSSAFDVKYCSLCDAYFYSAEMLKAHLQSSSRHPHTSSSPRTNFCRICEKHFKTSAGLRIHIDYSHLDSDTEDGPSTQPEGWEDRLGLEQDAGLNGGEIPLPQEDIAGSEAVSGLAARVATEPPQNQAHQPNWCPAADVPHLPLGAEEEHVRDAVRARLLFWPAATSQLRTLDLHVFVSVH
ncbi:hypothetical protein B0H14DRAFT_3891921 [Mycena olivaceomarginata]|nr:hypothetical protein B0H14DRAFT_3891921 [Mycena olivaceomarginata]